MTQQNQQQQTQALGPDPARVARMAIQVAQEMHNHTVSKKHGEYQIFEDGKIQICLDTWVPNIEVDVVQGDKRITVFSAAYHSLLRPTQFHPGKWMEHLEKLNSQADQIRQEKEAARDERNRREEAARFAPIDDSGIFGDDE